MEAGAIHVGEGTVPVWSGAGNGTLYFNQADGKLYFRRSDTGAIVGPLGDGVRHHLLTGTDIVVAPTFEYLVQGPFTIDAGASLTLDGADARLSVI